MRRLYALVQGNARARKWEWVGVGGLGSRVGGKGQGIFGEETRKVDTI